MIMESTDVLGSSIGPAPDENLLDSLVDDLKQGRIRVNEIALYLQSVLRLIYKGSSNYCYDEKTGIWIVAEVHIINNRIADFLTLYSPTRADNIRINDIRRRLFDIVRERHQYYPKSEKTRFVNFRNKLYDIETEGVYPHIPDIYSFFQLPVDFDRKATCPMWLEFIDFVTEGDLEVARLLRNFVGLILSERTDIQHYLHIIGSGGTGKSTFAKTIHQLIGREQTAILDFGNERDNFSLSAIEGKKFLFVDEFEYPRLSPQAEGHIKSLASFGPVRVNQKYKNALEIYNRGRLIICSNNFPLISDASNALFRRLLLVKFEKTIPRDSQTKWFSDTNAFQKELPGIALWALEGLKEVEALGSAALALPDKVIEWIEEIKNDANPVMRWVQDCCDFVTDQKTPTEALYKSYSDWFIREGMHSQFRSSKNSFSKKLKQAFPSKIQSDTDGNSRGYKGITLKIKPIS
ncbi:hypothetical protein F9K33_10930 [bacterium]|nr:MAG: hypothetical protein F9K33_10930 [bacterium]